MESIYSNLLASRPALPVVLTPLNDILNAFINGTQNYGTSQTITISNTTLEYPANVEAIAGHEIRILPEFKTVVGSKLHLKVDSQIAIVP